MSAALEIWLARLYTDAELRARFLADPVHTLREAQLKAEQRRQLLSIDREGLRLHAHSLDVKRRSPAPCARPRWRDRVRAWCAERLPPRRD